MSDKTKIEWTDATWNPITGCSIVSPGCIGCYAMKLAGGRLRNHPSRKGLTKPSRRGPVWTGEMRLNEDWIDQPLHWQRPRMIFVCAHSDLFHEDVPDEWVDRVFDVMEAALNHTYQVLTKRADRQQDYVTKRTRDLPFRDRRHIWLGTSAERQKEADDRIPLLLETPAAVRFVSLEPLLGPIDLSEWPRRVWLRTIGGDGAATRAGLDWVIVGGESGARARPMHPDWARSLRDQCAAADVPFFFKQWGRWAPSAANMGAGDGLMAAVGKKAAGRFLDGRTHNGFPEMRQ